MEIYLLNTANGLIPLYDDDYDNKRKLKIGLNYKAKIVVPRDITKHRKYFSLINCAYSYLNESQIIQFGPVDNFRKAVEIDAGWYDLIYCIELDTKVKMPKSIAFDSMSGDQMDEVYERVKDVLLGTKEKRSLLHITADEFLNQLKNY